MIGGVMKKLLFIIIFSFAILLTGCERNIFTLPVKENPEALLRFNQPAEYAYNPAHYPVTIENYNTQGEPEKMTYTKPPQRVMVKNLWPVILLKSCTVNCWQKNSVLLVWSRSLSLTQMLFLWLSLNHITDMSRI